MTACSTRPKTMMKTSSNCQNQQATTNATSTRKATGAPTTSNALEINAMTVKCLFCKDTKIEPGIPGPCIWCETVGLETTSTVERFTIAKLRYAGGLEHNVRYVSEVHYDAALAEIEAKRDRKNSIVVLMQERDALQQLLNVADQKVDSLGVRVERLRHVGMELTGVISEYRAMQCESLKERMFNTVDRYRKRLNANCNTCEDYGVVGYTTGQTPESFDQGEYPCPECHPTEYAARIKP